MANDLLKKYIWLMDTFRKYGKITFKEINRRWCQWSESDGKEISRRTFYNYREAMERIFNVSIEYDARTFQFYLTEDDNHNRSVTDWLLDSTATSALLSASREVSGRIFLENVPSAREHLGVVVDSLKANRVLQFKYHAYNRLQERVISMEPYFLKIFRQRWYVTGKVLGDKKIKTYALDRMLEARVLDDEFVMPETFNADEYCRHSFGIIFNMGEVKRVVLKVEKGQAKYLRDLPLHHSQREMAGDSVSLFIYDLRITPDFIQELLSFGEKVTVLEPRDLRMEIVEHLKRSLENYEA